MKKRAFVIVTVVIAALFLASAAMAAEKKKKGEPAVQEMTDSQYVQFERILDRPGAMKDYVLSQKDVNLRYRKGSTLLHYAANRGYPDVVRLLVEKGADINAQDNDGRTPLHEAMAYRRYDVARYLIENGARMSLRNKDGETALISVVYMDDRKLAKELADLFISSGFNPPSAGDAKLLNEAIGRGHPAVAMTLIEKGIPFDDTSLYNAARQGYDEIFLILFAKGAKPSQQDILRAAAGSGNVKIIKKLVDTGKRPTIDDVDFAAYKGRAEAAAYLTDVVKRETGQDYDAKKRCSLKPDSGPCKALFDAGYYEPVAKMCRTFIYGGCGGTVPFETVEACQRICEEPGMAQPNAGPRK